jgi:hypothetical protein
LTGKKAFGTVSEQSPDTFGRAKCCMRFGLQQQ